MYKILTLLIFVTLSAKAQIPEFKQNIESYINKNTIYPPYSLHNCIQGTVNISFKLNAKGDVYGAKVSLGIGTDLDSEALRLIRMSSGKWTIPNQYDTTTVLLIPIRFALLGYNCERLSKTEIAFAINAYKKVEELINVVTSFYRAKEKGTAKLEDEYLILKIKNQLGIDDEYLEQKINDGLKKIKQGDTLGACEDFNFVKYMGSDKASQLIVKYCN